MTVPSTVRSKPSPWRWFALFLSLVFGASILLFTKDYPVLSPLRPNSCIITSSPSHNVTVVYKPSAWEQHWAVNIELFQLDICANLFDEASFVKMQSLLDLMDGTEHVLLQSDPVRPVSAAKQLMDNHSDLLSEVQFVDRSNGGVVASYKVEPLVGFLRDPRPLCMQSGSNGFVPAHKDLQRRFVLHDAAAIQKHSRSGRAFMFDIGASKWNDDFGGLGLRYFLQSYGNLGMTFDHVYAWEARDVTPDYWIGMPVEVRGRVHLYNMPASAVEDDVDNPWSVVLSMTEPEDYVVVKLDVDTPSVEMPLVDQLLRDPKLSARVDDFYFEHHVGVNEMRRYWGADVRGSMVDSYNLFRKLRERGIRAHSWP